MRFTLVFACFASFASLSLLAADEAAPITVTRDKDILEFRAGKELITRFETGTTYPKQILYPVNAPGEIPLTRAWPMVKGKNDITTDHIHHRSIWVGHVAVFPEGLVGVPKKGVNMWEEPADHGNVFCVKVDEPKVEGDQATVASKHEWKTKDGVLILHEDRVMIVKNLGSARLISIALDLYTGDYPIKFGDDKDGFFGTRVNDQINADAKTVAKGGGKGKIQNAEGKVGEKDCWGYPSAWCDYSGPVDGKQVGLTLLVDPANPIPSMFHVRDYGLMAANPFGKDKSFPGMKGVTEEVKLAKGEHLKLRYGVLMHEGDAISGHVAEHFKTFVALKGKE